MIYLHFKGVGKSEKNTMRGKKNQEGKGVKQQLKTQNHFCSLTLKKKGQFFSWIYTIRFAWMPSQINFLWDSVHFKELICSLYKYNNATFIILQILRCCLPSMKYIIEECALQRRNLISYSFLSLPPSVFLSPNPFQPLYRCQSVIVHLLWRCAAWLSWQFQFPNLVQGRGVFFLLLIQLQW